VTDSEASPIYGVDLGPDAGFVEKDANGTLWIWLQHFSTREFTVVLPLRDAAESERAESPGAGMAGVLTAFGLLAFVRRRRR
jgi:MYXO-CTERM domain-containing protein